MTPYSLAGVIHCSEGICCLHLLGQSEWDERWSVYIGKVARMLSLKTMVEDEVEQNPVWDNRNSEYRTVTEPL